MDIATKKKIRRNWRFTKIPSNITKNNFLMEKIDEIVENLGGSELQYDRLQLKRFILYSEGTKFSYISRPRVCRLTKPPGLLVVVGLSQVYFDIWDTKQEQSRYCDKNKTRTANAPNAPCKSDRVKNPYHTNICLSLCSVLFSKCIIIGVNFSGRADATMVKEEEE